MNYQDALIAAHALRLDEGSDWEEDKHPRDDKGQFAGGGGTVKTGPAMYLKIERPGGAIEHVGIGDRFRGTDYKDTLEKFKQGVAKAGKGRVISLHVQPYDELKDDRTEAEKTQERESNEYGEHRARMARAMGDKYTAKHMMQP